MEVYVSPDDRRFQERWKDIAERVSKEQDSQKLTKLTNELIDALNEHTKYSQPAPDANRDDEEHARRKCA
jgi:ribosomal protein S7